MRPQKRQIQFQSVASPPALVHWFRIVTLPSSPSSPTNSTTPTTTSIQTAETSATKLALHLVSANSIGEPKCLEKMLTLSQLTSTTTTTFNTNETGEKENSTDLQAEFSSAQVLSFAQKANQLLASQFDKFANNEMYACVARASHKCEASDFQWLGASLKRRLETYPAVVGIVVMVREREKEKERQGENEKDKAVGEFCTF